MAQALIQIMEKTVEEVNLSSDASATLAAVKGRLIAAKNYLEEWCAQAKISEHIDEVTDAIKSGLDVTKEQLLLTQESRGEKWILQVYSLPC